MVTLPDITTAEQLFAASGLGRCELIRGELIAMNPTGFEHGRVVANITIRLGAFVQKNGLGVVTGAETGFRIGRDPDTVRAPDVGFVRAEAVPATPLAGFMESAPDLVVEVLSPGDRASEVLGKVQDWLAAGTRAVWVVDPVTRTVSVYRGPKEASVLRGQEELAGEDIVPGFRLPIGEIFES